MKQKILVIGQAPPAQKQSVPYDTTMLYEWLAEVGIDKVDAQDMFEFTAMYDTFPGYNSRGGHVPPTEDEMEDFWERKLRDKVLDAQKVWVLGAVAKGFLERKEEMEGKYVLYTIHPSKRNRGWYSVIRTELLTQIDFFLNK